MKCPSCEKWISVIKTIELALGNKKFVCPNCGSISERDKVRDRVNVGLSMLAWGFLKLHPIGFTGYPDLSGVVLAFGVFTILDILLGKLVLVYKAQPAEAVGQ